MSQLIDSSLSAQFNRLPPNAVEAEMCLVGSMMLAGDASSDDRKLMFAKLTDVVCRDAFYQADHQIFWDVLISMHEKGIKIDVITTVAQLKKRGLYEEVGGKDYITKILATIPSWMHWESYATIIAEKFKLRQLISTSNQVLRLCYAATNLTDPADDIVNHCLAELSEIQRSGRVETSMRIGEAAAAYVAKRESGGEMVDRVLTGLKDIDEEIGGLELGLFYLIGGRPGSGKSQTAKQVLLNTATAGTPSGLITIEERREKVVRNLLANESGVANRKIAYRRETDEEWKAVKLAAGCLADLPLWIEDSTESVTGVVNKMTIFAIEKKVKVVAIDYLQLIDPGNTDGTRADQVRQISRAIKMTAKRLNIAAVCCVQLNRGNETGGVRKPELRDLRESGSIEQDGDVIILCHREDYYKYKEQGYQPTGQLEAIIAKNKDNSPSVVPLYFDGDRQSITDWDTRPNQADDIP